LADIISDIIGAISGSASLITSFIQTQGYAALLFLMTLEGIGFPVPSEVVIPAAGFFAAKGILNVWFVFIVILIGNTIGMVIDYAIGYYLEKELVYNHLKLFHVRQESLDAFDGWFKRNGSFAVFVSRMLPEVRALMSFPAGFAKMDLKKFLFWSILGSAIWDALLLLFGYYVISTSNFLLLSVGIASFLIILYLMMRMAMKRIKSQGK
jgi:membrane protein DedA with SNARE-associated domain